MSYISFPSPPKYLCQKQPIYKQNVRLQNKDATVQVVTVVLSRHRVKTAINYLLRKSDDGGVVVDGAKGHIEVDES